MFTSLQYSSNESNSFCRFNYNIAKCDLNNISKNMTVTIKHTWKLHIGNRDVA